MIKTTAGFQKLHSPLFGSFGHSNFEIVSYFGFLPAKAFTKTGRASSFFDPGLKGSANGL
jgi:hypothetical protein